MARKPQDARPRKPRFAYAESPTKRTHSRESPSAGQNPRALGARAHPQFTSGRVRMRLPPNYPALNSRNSHNERLIYNAIHSIEIANITLQWAMYPICRFIYKAMVMVMVIGCHYMTSWCFYVYLVSQ